MIWGVETVNLGSFYAGVLGICCLLDLKDIEIQNHSPVSTIGVDLEQLRLYVFNIWNDYCTVYMVSNYNTHMEEYTKSFRSRHTCNRSNNKKYIPLESPTSCDVQLWGHTISQHTSTGLDNIATGSYLPGPVILQQTATISRGSFPAWHCHEEQPLSWEEATITTGSHYHRADTIVTGGQYRTGSHHHMRQPLSQRAASIPKGSSYLKRQLQGPMSPQAFTQPFSW